MFGRHDAGRRFLALAMTTASVASADGPSDTALEADLSPSGPRLEWLAPPGCPTRDQVLAHVATLAESDRLHWDRFEVVRASIARAGARWSLALEFVAPAGVRKRALHSGHCSELAEAAAVAIVLAHRSGESDAPSSAETPAAPPATSAASAAPAEASHPPLPEATVASEPSNSPSRAIAVPRHASLSVSAEAALDPTTLGAAAFGGSLGVGLGLGTFSFGLYGAGFPSAATRLGAGQSIELGLWAGGLRSCFRWGRGLDTCASMELGEVRARGVGLNQARQSSDLWSAPGLSVGFTSTPFDGFGITTRIAAVHPLVRGRYRVDDADVVHRLPLIGFRASIGVDLPLL